MRGEVKMRVDAQADKTSDAKRGDESETVEATNPGKEEGYVPI